MRTSRFAFAGILDQGVSSLTNMLALVFAARRLDLQEFGYFATGYVIYTLVLSLAQAFFGQPLVLERDALRRRALVAEAVRSTTALGLLTIIAGVTLWVLGSEGLWPALGGLLAFAPALLLQDQLRFVSSAVRRPWIAVTSDVLWLAWVLLWAGLASPLGLPATAAVQTLLWVTGSLLGLLPAVIFRRGARDLLRRGTGLLAQRQYLGHRFVLESVATRGASQGSVLALGALSSAATVGALRGVSTIFGPLNVLYNALHTFGPGLFRSTPRSSYERRFRLLTLAVAGIAALWGLALALLPTTAGRVILGDSWTAVAELVVPTGVQYVFLGISTVGLLGLRLVDPTATFWLRLALSLVLVACSFGGYYAGGVRGVAWGLAGATALQAAVVWVVLQRRLSAGDVLVDRSDPRPATVEPS